MRYVKKVMKQSGGLVVRIPADIVKLLELSEKDFVEIDLTKIDVKKVRKGVRSI
ncbi:MAG: hypothetical protein QF362_04280 [Candidatus Woesearchaeota archaeon]|nr:hypothetical protein [Candidatus Woesearchaeota archaeon]MDP7506631.1 hypothetical protein [Candidatus Woesearchaeota archaeon]|tara:strand:+ start:2569 stop:2730 length:162 start_codon:yes stop_codon:yes gene_type:complete